MHRFIFIILLIMLLFVQGTAGPRLVVLPDGIIDLGEFEEKEVQTREVFVKNTGDEPLIILKTFSSCSCTQIKYSSSLIVPGDSAAITVIFDGRNRRPGPVKKVFRLTSNAENSVTNVLVKGDIVRPFQK